MKISYEKKFILWIVMWFSLSLSTPITYALDFDPRSIFIRVLFTGLALLFFVFVGTYPLFVLELTAILLIVGFYFYLLLPAFILQVIQFFAHIITI